jgi:hypothetical protein
MTKQEHYDDMHKKYFSWEITHEEWTQYCANVLSEILNEPEVRDVLTRLAYQYKRW